jgi:hypothetical protein
MPAAPGTKPPRAGRGRPPGSPNKVTRDARQAFADLLDSKSEKAARLWEIVAKKDPARALEILGKLGEYVMPKLARTEHSGPHGGAIPIASASANISDDDAMKSYQRLLKGETP